MRSMELGISHMNIYMSFSCMKYGILCISPVEISAQTFQNKNGNLYISYEHLCTHFPTWNSEFYIFHTWRPGCWFSHMKSGILYISLMNIWPLMLVYKKWNFDDFIYVNWDTDFPLLSMDFAICHIRKFWQRLNPWNNEFSILHLGKSGSRLSDMKYSILYISQMKI